MIVYHGTTDVIESPDVNHSKKYLDFGKGFYLTTYEEQAKNAIVNVYELKDNLNDAKVLSFDKEKVLKELRYYKMNDQICIVNQKTLDNVLKFKMKNIYLKSEKQQSVLNQ